MARNPYKGLEDISKKVRRAHEVYLRLALEAIEVDMMRVTERIWGAHNEKLIRMSDHSGLFPQLNLYHQQRGVLLVPFTSVSATGKVHAGPQVPSAFCREQQFKELILSSATKPPSGNGDELFFGGVALEMHYPTQMRVLHARHARWLGFGSAVRDSGYGFFCTSRNLGDDALQAALVKRFTGLRDLLIKFQWQSQFTDSLTDMLVTPGQVKRLWPSVALLMPPRYEKKVSTAKATGLPLSVRRKMGEFGLSEIYIKNALQEITDSVVSAEMVQFDTPVEAAPDRGVLADANFIWINSSVVEENS